MTPPTDIATTEPAAQATVANLTWEGPAVVAPEDIRFIEAVPQEEFDPTVLDDESINRALDDIREGRVIDLKELRRELEDRRHR